MSNLLTLIGTGAAKPVLGIGRICITRIFCQKSGKAVPSRGGRIAIERVARIGANEVVVRSIRTGDSHAEYTPIGHTTNLASRIQMVAPTGSIAVSEATRKLVGGP